MSGFLQNGAESFHKPISVKIIFIYRPPFDALADDNDVARLERKFKISYAYFVTISYSKKIKCIIARGPLYAFREFFNTLSHEWPVKFIRSQKHNLKWDRMKRLIAKWLPLARVCHPYPLVRFGVIT
jgi:hypothetical protein